MTAFYFMQAAFFIAVGIVCLSVAALIGCAVVMSIIGMVRKYKGEVKK
jgi:hypothetical protein